MTQAGGWQHEKRNRPDGAFLRLSRWQTASADDAPTLLLLTGRSECVEKYAEVASDMAAQGFRVVAMDWRGQGGSARPLANPLKGHIDRFDTYLDDLEASLPHLLGDTGTGPVLALAHSMGGHLLLRYVAERAHPFTAVMLSAPMLGIRTSPLPAPLARLLASTMVTLGRGGDYAPGQRDWYAADPAFDGNPLTSDPVRFLVGHRCYAAQPDLALGGATWGWLDAAFRSMAHLRRPDMLGQVRIPVLLLSGLADRIVQPDSHVQAARLLPDCHFRQYPTARHELLMESDAIRAEVMAEIADFASAFVFNAE
ncbi:MULTISPECIES: alpha/beta fold hydrolase [unclassified Azospirillum]|uniref:alpha/beta fold hydrolase n=1 Tax=unclassified Azospirillum TaxID=2630922 RepID=UPI000B765EB7|nr:MULTISPECIES: alpha/beta hydrolase [unclassified Azospirillum]SNS28678.1 lysophospholipase [Azospirillum sp. RU38E]SNS47175.1 lysophospholipase [Azospirillum sp. RU37A]